MSVIEINKGECLHAEIAWTDEGGPIDLTGRTVEITEAYPAALMQGVVTVTDPAAGIAEIRVEAEHVAAMGAGRVNWLRLGMSLPDGCIKTTPRISVEVA